MDIDRRRFLRTSIAGAGALAMAGTLSAAEDVNPYALVPLGKTGLKITRIGMGTGMNGGYRESNHTRMGQEKFTAIVRHAYERGVRLFDAADMYGTHRYLARALKGIPRNSYAIVSKIWAHPRGGLPEAERPDANILLDRFRRELSTDYVDVVLLHCMMSGKWAEDFKRQMEIMDNLKSKGVIKAHGVSIHSRDALKVASEHPWVDTAHVRINHAGTAMDSRNVDDVVPVVRAMRQIGKGIIAMKVCGEGAFKKPEQRDQSIRFVLGLVDAMVVGFEAVEQVDDFEMRVASALKAQRNL